MAALKYHYSLKHSSKQVKSFQDFKGKPIGEVGVISFADIKTEFNKSEKSFPESVVFAEKTANIAGGALKKIENYFLDHEEASFVYGDSGFDLNDSAGWFYRPNWSPHYFLYAFYTGGMFAVRGSLLASLETIPDFTGDPLTDAMKLFYAAGLKAGAFSKSEICPVGHIPFVLYKEDFEADRARYKEAATSFFESVKPEIGTPKVSALILSKDHPEVVRTCIESLSRCSLNTELEIILVDNGSSDENREIVDKYCREHGATYIYHKSDFNFSVLCNLAASHATGDYYLFCNDDIEFVEPDTLYKLVEAAAFDFAGEAGLKLLYPENSKIQHAGVVNVIAGPTHKYQYCDDTEEYYFGINRNVINTVCATAACLMLKKERFEEAGGFPEDLAVAFNDVALGFALCRKGYYNACRNDIHAIHYESLTRGYDYEDEAKLKRLMAEHDVLYGKFPEYLNGKDPYISPYMSKNSGSETSSAIVFYDANRVGFRPIKKTRKYDRFIAENREDLMLLRIFEHVEKDSEVHEEGSDRIFFMSGYCFVYHFDNIGLRKKLVLSGPGGNYEIKLKQVFRPDLVKDYPSEKNIAFCGFEAAFDASKLEPGEYKLYFFMYDTASRLTQFRIAERTINL